MNKKRPHVSRELNNTLLFAIVLISTISVFFILFISSFNFFLYNLNYYDSQYIKYNIYDRFTKNVALNQTNSLFGFFKSKNELDSSFFNPDEISHLMDVKSLIEKMNLIYYVSLALFWVPVLLIYFYFKRSFLKFFADVLLISGILTLSLFILLAIVYFSSGFDFLFLRFHTIFFVGNYAFDPRVSNMKAMFPDAFFLDIAIAIILITLLKGLLMLIAGYIIRKKVAKISNQLCKPKSFYSL